MYQRIGDVSFSVYDDEANDYELPTKEPARESASTRIGQLTTESTSFSSFHFNTEVDIPIPVLTQKRFMTRRKT